MKTGIGVAVAAFATVAVGGTTYAGAWNMPKGEGQVIVKYEPFEARRYFDDDGDLARLPFERRDQVVGVWGEYGLTDAVTLVLKADWQDSQDGFYDFKGHGPVEIGARWEAVRTQSSVLSVQAIYAFDGDGRNASWAAPGQGRHEAEVRLLAARRFETKKPFYIEAQLARRFRDDLPDETRLDATLGMELGQNWTSLSQVYAGSTDLVEGGTRAQWITAETGLVRDFGDWSVQGSWRRTFWGRNVPSGSGPIVALWRRF